MTWVWSPEKDAYINNSGKPKYYCNRCKYIHYFGSKKGVRHIFSGKHIDIIFLPGGKIIPRNNVVIWDESNIFSGMGYKNIHKKYIQKFLEFRINEYITLKLEHNRTNIYINNILFRQCKYLLLNLAMDNIPEYDEIESIDEAMEMYSRKNETNKTMLDPETEFMGHCSNLQAWVENDYNVNILHSKLSFPLLKQLMLLGDKKAIIVFKETMVDVLIKGGEKAVVYFLYDTDNSYLNMFELEELEVLFDDIDIKSQKILRMISKLINRKRIINGLKKRRHININLEECGRGVY